MKFSAVRGTKDILPPESDLWQQLEALAIQILETYGFEEIRIPVFENTELFVRSIGQTTDIVTKEMYTFKDKKGRLLTLRPEGTAGVIRAMVENNLLTSRQTLKLYYRGEMFRYERPQAGRYRQFYQIGAEIIGANHPLIDAEIIKINMDLFEKIGLPNLQVHLNSVGCQNCRPTYKEALQRYLHDKKTSLCDNCHKRLAHNPLRILDCKNDDCKKIVAQAPVISQYLCLECQEHLNKVKKYLQELGLAYIHDEHLVRGLDYYTKTTFEIKFDKLGAQDTISAGGRYDNLVKELGGADLPAVGFALGMERLVETLRILKIKISLPAKTKFYLAILGEEVLEKVYKYLYILRDKNIPVFTDLKAFTLKHHLAIADKSNIPYCVIIGEDELRNNKALLKDMATGKQEEISLENLIQEIERRAKIIVSS